jgi:sterol 3beta-glucosyltransferase
MYVPTGEFPAMMMPNPRLGRWYNRLTYRFIEKASWWGTRKYVNEWRTANDLPRRRGPRHLKHVDGKPIPALHAYSESVIPRPSDWPETAIVTGYWFLDRTQDWRPPGDLEAFLARGAPPVYFGFGSIFGRDPQRVTRIVLDAIKAAGVRAIISRGWGGLDPSHFVLPPDVLAIDSAPHDWLFPRVAAVVHHGGCGTTAAGLRAGRPTSICPLFGDQPFWGAKIQALGVGPAPIPQKRLSVDHLCTAIHQVMSDAPMRQRAEALGQRIRNEDGVARAVDFIHRWVER